jgi:hypothetical protein
MPSRVMSVALRNTKSHYVNAMVRVTKQQQQRSRVHVSATSIAPIAPGQVFILPFHVSLDVGSEGKSRGSEEESRDACTHVDVEVVLVSDEQLEVMKQLHTATIEPNSHLLWSSLPPPPGAEVWGRVTPPPSVRCRKVKNSSFRFTFIAHDGSAAEAAAVPPRDATCVRAPPPAPDYSCPIVVTLHGTGVSCSDAADAYKLQKRDGTWLFGVRGAWLLAPTRSPA